MNFKPKNLNLVFILVAIFSLSFILYTAWNYAKFDYDNGLVVKDFYSNYDFTVVSTKPNASILKRQYYVLQKDQMHLIINETSNRIICFPTDKIMYYTLCHYPGDQHGDHVKLGYNLDQAKSFLNLLYRFPGAGFIDLGANIGTLSLPLMKYLNGSRSFVLVEPNANNIAALLKGIQQNKLENDSWAIIPRAMWNETDLESNIVQWDLTSNGHLEFLNHMKGIHNLPFGYRNMKQVPVKTATMDSHVLPVANALGIKSAILKLDIEGSECMAFKNSHKLLSQIFIPYIFMEYWPAYKMQDDWSCVRGMIETLASFGYAPFRGHIDLTMADRLDLKAYKRWTDKNIFWKKII